MLPIVIALVLETVTATVLVGLSSPSLPVQSRGVLGEQIILADETTPSDSSNTQPADNPSSADTTTNTSGDAGSQTTTAPDTGTQTPTQTPATGESSGAGSDQTNQTATPIESPGSGADNSAVGVPNGAAPDTNSQTSISTPASEPRAVSEPPQENTASASGEAGGQPVSTDSAAVAVTGQEALFSPEESMNNSSQIDSQSVAEVAQEEGQLEGSTQPEVKAALLTHFASDKINDIDHFTADEDHASTTFATQRLGDQIDQLAALSSQAPPSTGNAIKQQLSDVCHQANTVLRADQEAVPEELEQDLEITRSKCFGE